MARRSSRKPRRGVVLLVILSLLVLFALLGVTFVIVSGQYKRSSQSYMRAQTYGDDPERQLDTAMYTALRGSTDPANPLGPHSLLEDVFGRETFYGVIESVGGELHDGQVGEFTCSVLFRRDWNGTPIAPSTDAGYFNGCVLTFYRPAAATAGTNRLAGTSCRVFGYATASGKYTFRIMRPTPDDASDVALSPGDCFIVNGRPFTGAGAGFDPTTGDLNATLVTRPNRAGQTIQDYLRQGANENWDAPDLQNLFLAAVIPDPNHVTGIKHQVVNGKEVPCIIPSFHRPALIQYSGGAANAQNSFRPLSLLPAIDPIYGPWDVDNDGDGIADSIWIDLNLPVQTTADGRRYKPLFAFKIADLDNRINVNFHGSPQHYSPAAVDAGQFLADGSQTNAFPVKGAGLGPGEVVLGTGDATLPLGIAGLSATQYRYLLEGDGTRPGRYGADLVAGSGGSGTPTPLTAAADPIGATRFFEIPRNYFQAGGALSSYQSTPDLAGQLARGVDARGQFVTDVSTDKTSDLRAAVTYRTREVYDRRFTPAELERLLRYYDIDAAQLPDRLERLAGVLSGGTGPAAAKRRLVTVDSRDMPVATAVPTKSVSDGLGSSKRAFRDPMDLLRRRLGASMLSETEILKLVDRDFYFGLKMNLNRPLGDGQDSDGNQIVDEPLPAEVGPAYNNGNGFHGANGLDLNNDGTKDATAELYVRHLLAKHLYILASLCVDTGSPPDQAVQHQLAQWAVNVVDFRDADAIMTAFEYDPNPFDGWNSACDGIVTADPYGPTRQLVWGCERPELLLSESLATHDRRTSDTDDEMAADPNEGDAQEDPKTTDDDPDDDMDKPDGSFDQKYLPEGSAFIEIYNPWQSKVERPPAEFYFQWGTGWKNGVRLDQTTPDGSSPVWRMLVVKGPNLGRDPDHPDTTQQPEDADKDRTVYFVDPTGKTVPTEQAKRYFPSHALAPLLPGRYAVVGSGPATGVGTPPKFVTYFGYMNNPPDPATHTATELGQTRRIELTPSTNPAVNQVRVLSNNHGAQPEPNYGADVQPAIAVVISKTTDGAAASDARFSFSEPVDGYGVAGAPQGEAALKLLEPVIDQPLDKQSPEKDQLMQDGMHEQFRRVHLQRLANPLLPYHQVTNPYLTIDSIGSDLVSFNGITAKKEPGSDGGDNDGAFDTLQRGEHNPNPHRQLWTRTARQNIQPAEPDATHFWGRKLHHTLGYLNSSYGAYYKNDLAAASKGDPDVTTLPTFPWLTWNNRPFNSVYEIMEVPWTRSSQLTEHFTVPLTVNSPYNLHQAGLGNSPPAAGTYQASQHGHLLNFYNDNESPAQVHGLYRIFDYLRIPSKYVEADTMLVASEFTSGTLAQNQFHPPFNWLSNYRDPGTININTIYSANVWNAILGGNAADNANAAYGLGPSFDQIVASRRGYGTSGDILERSNSVPTEFAGAFRAAGTGKMGPAIPSMNPANDIDVTLLRKNATTSLPLLGNNNTQPYNHSARHPYFRHQTLQRLSNTLTTRSNVYACWVTIGYFEVDANGLLGQELHADTGEVERHRAFYMIDRSIPVGFEPGENHNVDRAILVRRYIE